MADATPQEMAESRVREILFRMYRKIGAHEEGARGVAASLAPNFFAPPDDQEAAAKRQGLLALAMALNPQTPADHPAFKYVAFSDMTPEQLRQQAFTDDEGRPYTGGGWSAEERKKLGREPGAWELSPGDLVAYQRQLDHDTLSSISRASDVLYHAERNPDPQHKAFASIAARSQMLDAVNSFDKSRGNTQASGFLGSTYPAHQGGNAFRDVLTSHSSPIGNYLQKGQFTSDVAAHAFMSPGVDPANQAAVTYEGDYHWNRPSPHYVPEGLTPEGRDQYIARGRELVDQTRPPDYSMSYAREYGEPPSYVWQGVAGLGNMFADFSLPAMFAGGKAVNATAKGLAKTSIPVASRYGAHIAGKTAPIAAASPGAFAVRESMEDGAFGAAIQGAGTARHKERPALLFPKLRGLPSAWEGGWENRPDLKAALLAEGVTVGNDPSQVPSRSQMLKGNFNDWYDRQAKQREQAARELAAMNRQSQESFDKSTALGRTGAAIGEVIGSMPSPPKQPAYLPPAFGPMLLR
jgi:hypothetical protein